MTRLEVRILTTAIGLAINALLSACSDEVMRIAKDVEGKAIAASAPCIEEYGDPRPLLPEQIRKAAHMGFPQSLGAIRSALGQPSKICGETESYALPYGGFFVLRFDQEGKAVSADWRN